MTRAPNPGVPMFRDPQVIFSEDLPRAVAFYASLGFAETFRVPAEGEPIHVDPVERRHAEGLRRDHGERRSGTRRPAAVARAPADRWVADPDGNPIQIAQAL